MKYLILILIVLISGCSSFGDPYLKFGLGYKFHETDISHSVDCNSKITVPIELGMELGGFSYGIKHESDLICGKPFKDGIEYTNDQVFIGYKFYFNKD